MAIDAATAVGAVRRSAAGVDSAVPVMEATTLEAALADSVAPYHFDFFTFGLFAAVALLLASVGIYGTLADSTSRRTQEIGGLLYEVSPSDPYIFAAAAALLLVAGFVASLGPAMRAAIDNR